MFDNFYMFAIIGKIGKSNTKLRLIEPQEPLRNVLIKDWKLQYNDFISKKIEVNFIVGYKPNSDEHFRIQFYDLPEWLHQINSVNASVKIRRISRQNDPPHSISGIGAFTRNEYGNELILFQNFNKSRIIRPGSYIPLNTEIFINPSFYREAGNELLNLDTKLSAMYTPSTQKLLFDSFRNVNTFLCLESYYREASEEDITNILDQSLFECRDIDAVIKNSTQAIRKQFAMLRDSNPLNSITAPKVQEEASNCNISVNVSNGKILFPADNSKIKVLLQFLNDGIFKSPLTNDIYETNSKKPAVDIS